MMSKELISKSKKLAKSATKKFGINHRRALDLAARLEGYKDWWTALNGEKTLPRCKSAFGSIFLTLTRFKKETLPPEVFDSLIASGEIYICDILKHPCCPLEVRKQYVNDPRWYVRLVAFCAASTRAHFFEQAIKDPKSTVRAAAIKGAYFDGRLTDLEVADLVVKDPRIAGYFWSWTGVSPALDQMIQQYEEEKAARWRKIFEKRESNREKQIEKSPRVVVNPSTHSKIVEEEADKLFEELMNLPDEEFHKRMEPGESEASGWGDILTEAGAFGPADTPTHSERVKRIK